MNKGFFFFFFWHNCVKNVCFWLTNNIANLVEWDCVELVIINYKIN